MELARLRQIVESIAAGDRSHSEILCERADACTLRTNLPDGSTLIVKLWARPSWRGKLRRASGTSPSQREWAAICRLHAAGLPVPQPIARVTLSRVAGGYTEAQLTGDLGELTPVMAYAKALRASARNDELDALEDEIIEVTALMIQAGVLDTDHSVVNLMVTSARRLVRIDFEIARVVRFPRLHSALLGGMIGRLVASYVFTHQPDVDLARRFAERLLDRTRPGIGAIRHARLSVGRALARQEREMGLVTAFSMPG
jgi:tRNA A-37 threonylcarbamoyl transferase component Bud32